MPRCLFCLEEREKLTDEHVFPAALGGNLIVANASCAECNNSFSNQFEQKIAGRLADFRRLLLIPDRRGSVPEIFVHVETNGETLDAKLMPDGQIQLKPLVTRVKKDGATEITFQHMTKRQKEDLRRQAQEEGIEFTEEITPARKAEVNISGDPDFIGSQEMLRTVTKIAYTALALRMGTGFAAGAIFSKARTYALNGRGTPPAKLFLHEGFLQACEQGPHQHSVVVVGRNDHHSVEAIVRLFGSICFFVTLADQYNGPDCYNTLVYDAQRGKEVQVLVANEQAEFLQVEEISTSRRTLWNDRVASGRSFLTFLARAMKAELCE
jgi:hypothetical protein